MRLEDLKRNVRVEGVVPGEPVSVVATDWHGSDALELTFKRLGGQVLQQVLYRSDQARLELSESNARPFDADAGDFKLVAEAQRIRLAGLFDPMLAVATSDVQPLPHQIRAVYGELLPRTPLRFLLADDPGAGKTIMAGLYIKELLLRDDVHRCLIVAPGGLIEQWQDELFFKFGLRFDILTTAMTEASLGSSVFETHPLLIVRMDQLARNSQLQLRLRESLWDLVVVDEAHRMGAHYFGNKVEKTKRFQLGEVLRDRTRHELLMTATPHAGKEEDFLLFLTLLDRDRFIGKLGDTRIDTSDVMRRMVKEDLRTFDGKLLFPERVAQTVPYQLTSSEQTLYEQVTNYVREGMDRADKLLDKKRKNTVGFALTVLQRRLASSPEAIYRSLERRAARLERRKHGLQTGQFAQSTEDQGLPTVDDPDEYSAAEIERLEDKLQDEATAAQTVQELETELAELQDLVASAKAVRDSNTDRKWSELRTILESNVLVRDNGELRKLIVFTEHRDTLHYLARRIRQLLGRPNAVQGIHGGIRRAKRRDIIEEFTKNPECQVLLATDAAGEGLNLQVAHLMVNYDLPWNPNRIEQRFGRIHRIGQAEVCRLWNLVASDTREGDVFVQLLLKIEEQRRAYAGRVFDVLGAAFDETPLRDLLIEAIRYGEQPEVKARMHQVIDERVSEGLKELLAERALARESLAETDLAELRRQMDEARARRLQPHYIEWAFRHAFRRLGGRLARREKGRFEISNVPAPVRTAANSGPIATKYERIAFDLEYVESDGKARADLLAPGHPLHDTVLTQTIDQLSPVLDRGTVLVSASVTESTLLVGVVEEVGDGTGELVARRFGYAYVDSEGSVTPAGPAPYLDCAAAPDVPAIEHARRLPWLGPAESKARSWFVSNRLSTYLDEVRPSRQAEIERTRQQVTQRLDHEINRLATASLEAGEKEMHGEKPRESSDGLRRKAEELQVRLDRRLGELDQQAQMSTKPPKVVTSALLVPLSMVEDAVPANVPMHAAETKEVERRGVDLVLATERGLGRMPIEQPFTNPGFDILTEVPDGDPIRIEVKARIAGAEDFFVTHNEVVIGKNSAPRYRLALVRVDPRGAEFDEVRYVADPFAGVEIGNLDVTGIRLDWNKTWARGKGPF